MASMDRPVQASPVEAARGQVAERVAGGISFDLVMVFLCLWTVFGLYIDGWAHNSGMVDTFFTPWHAILYSGLGAVAAWLVYNQLRNMARGYAWDRALPHGYLLALLGVAIFMIAGAFDLIWHTLFGFEETMEALLSPSHLLLASGGFLFFTAPLRAAWNRGAAQGWRDLLPVVLTLLAILCELTFFTQFASHVAAPHQLLGSRPGENTFLEDFYGVSSMLFSGLLYTGVILFALRRWQLPPGSLLLIFAANGLLMMWMRSAILDDRLLVGLSIPLSGVWAEALLQTLRPSYDRVRALRLFSFLLPLGMSLLLVLLLNLVGGGMWWKIHMWLGVPFVAGIGGLLLSYVAIPPPVEA